MIENILWLATGFLSILVLLVFLLLAMEMFVLPMIGFAGVEDWWRARYTRCPKCHGISLLAVKQIDLLCNEHLTRYLRIARLEMGLERPGWYGGEPTEAPTTKVSADGSRSTWRHRTTLPASAESRRTGSTIRSLRLPPVGAVAALPSREQPRTYAGRTQTQQRDGEPVPR